MFETLCVYVFVCLFVLFKPLIKRHAYHAYTSCIFLTFCLAEIDPSSSIWTRPREGRLIRSELVKASPFVETATMSENFDLEAFRR